MIYGTIFIIIQQQTLSIHTLSEINDRSHFFYLIKEVRPAVGFRRCYSQTPDLKFNSNIRPKLPQTVRYVHSDNHELYHRSSVRNISDRIFSQTLNPHPPFFLGGGINSSVHQQAVFFLLFNIELLEQKFL
jgi:hypothetical protein